MSRKYSYELKLQIVQEYLKGRLGYGALTKKYDISSSSLVKKWVAQFREEGPSGLKKRKLNKHYSLNFKLNVLRFKQETGASYKDVAIHFNIHEPSIIANWKRVYESQGAEGLNKPKGRPPIMPKSNQKPSSKSSNSNTIDNELDQLKKENEYLRIELAYLKKLEALGLSDPRADRKPK